MKDLHTRTWLAALSLMALVTAGCGGLADVSSPTTDDKTESSTDEADPVEETSPTTTTTLPFGSIADLEGISGQIVVSTVDGTLEILTLDGERRALINRCLTAAVPVSFSVAQGCPTQLFTQPTWSPDSSAVVATVVSADDQNAIAVVNVDDPGDLLVTNTNQPPYFYNWRDDGQNLVALGPGRSGQVTLNRANSRGTILNTITEAVPIFVDWEPNGSDLIVHEGDQLNTHIVDANEPSTELSSGLTVGNSFMTPIFVPDSRTSLAISDNELIIVDVDSGTSRALTALRPDEPNELWQYQMTATSDGTMLALLGYSPTGAALIEMVDLVSGERQEISDRPALWMEWNQQGTHLLLLTVVDGFAQWQLWSVADGLLDHSTPVEPSGTELSGYIPFFDQYVASVHRWSPDGKAFVFSGMVDGREGVWVQPVDPWTRPVPMGDGLVAWWSPT